MTLRSSADVAFLLIAGRSVMGRTTSFQDDEEAIVEETTALGDTTDSWTPIGQRTWKLSQDGFYDSATLGILEALNQSGAQVLMYGLEGNAIGRQFMGASAIRTKLSRGATKAALTKLTAEFATDRGCDEGVILADLVARTTLGPTDLTSYDWTATYATQTTGQIVAYLSVTDLVLNGGTSITIVLRDSDDNVTFADRIVFTNVTAAPASERKTYAAAVGAANDIGRYTRVRHTFNGASGAARTVTYAVGAARYLGNP